MSAPVPPRDPSLTHAFEQYGAMVGQFSTVVAAYFKGLIREGFQRDEALALTISWQALAWARILSGGKEDEPDGR